MTITQKNNLRAGQRLLDHLGRYGAILGLHLLAFGALFKVSWGNAALGFLLLAALVGLATHPRAWCRQKWLILLLTYWMVVLASSLRAHHLYPEEVETITQAAWAASYRGALSIVLVAWAVHIAKPRLDVLLGLLASGFALRIASQLDATTWQELLSGQARATFGNAATLFGLWCGGCLVGLAAHAPCFLGSQKMRLARLGVWLGGLCFFAAGLVASGARLAWLATALVLLAMWWHRPAAAYTPGAMASGRAGRLGVLAAVLILGAVALSQHTGVRARLGESAQVIRQLLTTGQIPTQGHSSLQIRLRLTSWALRHIAEHPIVGHGPGTIAPLLAQDGFMDEAGKPYRHVHNSTLQLALELGVLGLALYVLMAIWILQALRQADIPPPQRLTLEAGLTLYALCSLGDEVLASYHGGFVLALLAGLPYGVTWERFALHTGTTHA